MRQLLLSTLLVGLASSISAKFYNTDGNSIDDTQIASLDFTDQKSFPPTEATADGKKVAFKDNDSAGSYSYDASKKSDSGHQQSLKLVTTGASGSGYLVPTIPTPANARNPAAISLMFRQTALVPNGWYLNLGFKQSSTGAQAMLTVKFDRATLKIYGPSTLMNQNTILKRTPIKSNTWHSMNVVFNWDKHTVSWFVDDGLMDTAQLEKGWDSLESIVPQGWGLIRNTGWWDEIKFHEGKFQPKTTTATLTTTTTSTTTTATTVTGTQIAALKSRLEELEEALKSDSTANTAMIQEEIKKVLDTLKEFEVRFEVQATSINELTAIKTGLESKVTELVSSRDDLKLQVATLTEHVQAQGLAQKAMEGKQIELEGKLESLLRAPEIDAFAGGPGCADGSNDCAPEVSTDGSGKMVLAANAGKIVFSTEQCAETDLCALSKQVEGMLEKFGN